MPVLWVPTNVPGSEPTAHNGKRLSESTCAIVGGGHGLVGGGFGEEIDEQDFVVRVNRLQKREPVLVGDLGRRQDIYLRDNCGPDSDGKLGIQYVGGDGDLCHTHAGANDPGACPFSAILLKGNNGRWEPGCSGETQEFDRIRNAATGSNIAWGMQTDDVLNAAFDLRDFQPPGWNKPSTGFHGVIMFALACRNVRLYGFAGTTTVDGHDEDVSHDIAAEHRLLDQLVSHTANLPPILRGAWQRTNVTIVC